MLIAALKSPCAWWLITLIHKLLILLSLRKFRHAASHTLIGLPGQFHTDQRVCLAAFIGRAAKLARLFHLNYRTARMFIWFYQILSYNYKHYNYTGGQHLAHCPHARSL
jgi:hypothetical protein